MAAGQVDHQSNGRVLGLPYRYALVMLLAVFALAFWLEMWPQAALVFGACWLHGTASLKFQAASTDG
jgi:hypothetical protein